MGVGQFCTKPGLIFGLNSSAFDQFQKVLAELLASGGAGDDVAWRDW